MYGLWGTTELWVLIENSYGLWVLWVKTVTTVASKGCLLLAVYECKDVQDSVAGDFSASAAATQVRIEADTVDENQRKPAKFDGIPWGLCHWLSVESSVRRWIPLAHQYPAVDAAISQCQPLPISRLLPAYITVVPNLVPKLFKAIRSICRSGGQLPEMKLPRNHFPFYDFCFTDHFRHDLHHHISINAACPSCNVDTEDTHEPPVGVTLTDMQPDCGLENTAQAGYASQGLIKKRAWLLRSRDIVHGKCICSVHWSPIFEQMINPV
ncbi:hypothetical protein DFH08DRAFT_809885 [Mycena albidolilacea]|uniref:Uncharacterized protein n=1 Tax=Mycena albidolilacea TaxID=1033008 RepID=A0AAD7EQ87_9AGAR|nr:hypothetical protein DFH08DRAFT_809885 [Mycena albidolilacea]